MQKVSSFQTDDDLAKLALHDMSTISFHHHQHTRNVTKCITAYTLLSNETI